MEGKDLEKMTATELRDYALQNHPDITGVHAMKKEDLIVAIRKATGEGAKETPSSKPEAKAKTGKKGLKQQIRQLKSEKDKLLQSKDKKALQRLRKKIKRFKRLTKRAA